MAAGDRLSHVRPDVWDRLAGQPLSGDALAARLAAPDTSERLLAALDRQGRRHLLIALDAAEVEYSDRRSRGIDVTTRELLVDGTRARYLDLLCREPLGFDVFDSLGGEVATVLAAGVEEPAIAVRRLLGKWRHFWLAQAHPILDREEQIGLFAELWFLVFWLLPKVGAARAVEAWRGPLRARHDIELPDCSIEVKATTSGIGRTHRIHGVEQLEPPENGGLFLFSLALREEGGGANTLQDVIERARDLTSEDDDAIVRFETRLAEAGYTPAVAEDVGRRLRVVDERLYKVEGSFPRLTPASFAGGVPISVEAITYTINLVGSDNHIVATRPEQFSIS